jgi:hypothetical protein
MQAFQAWKHRREGRCASQNAVLGAVWRAEVPESQRQAQVLGSEYNCSGVRRLDSKLGEKQQEWREGSRFSRYSERILATPCPVIAMFSVKEV